MFKLKSARGQALLASLLLLLILGGISAVAVWRVQSDRAVRRTLESRATAVAALNDARAGFFLNINLLIAGVFAGDPAPFAEEYSQRRLLAAESIAAARAELTALNETEEIATLDTIGDSIEEMQQEIDVGVSVALSVDRETVIQMAGEYEGKLWPRFETIMADTDKLAKGEQAKLVADRAAADRASDATLTLLIGLGVAAFLVASAILAMFILSLLRPLASLQASARAIISGNWEARAPVSGPEETASLARDFNEMTETLVERSALLEESEGRFRNVLDVSRDFIYKLNVKTGTYDYVSPSVLRLTGFTPEEFIAMELKGVAERAHPEDKTLLNMPFRMVLDLSSEDSSVARVEYRWKHKDGEYLWVSDSRSLIRDENGRAIALVGTVRDETKRKQAEAALRESEEQFRNVLEVSRDLIYKLNLQTRTYDYVSPSSLRLVGFAPQEVVAMGLEGVRERFHPEDRERLGTHPGHLPDDTVEGREAPTIEYRWQCEDGEYRWLSDNRAFVLDEDGRALALVGTVRDITEDKQAEAALRESEERFRTLSASAPIGIFQTDMQARFTYVNEHLLGIHGVRLEELLGQVWTKRIHPDDRRATAEEALKAGSEIRTFSREYRILRPQGEIRWIRVVSSPVLSRDGGLVGFVGAAEDITERKRAEEVTDIERDLAIALNAAISLEETLRLSLEAAVRVSGTDCGGIYFVDGSSGALDLAYHQGLSSHFMESVSHYDADSPNARLVMAGEPVYSRYDQAVPSADEPGRHEGPRTIAVIPILHHRRVIACLNVSSHTLDEVPAASRSALETIASQIGAAIARGRAEEALRESEERFRSLSASAPIGIFLTDAEGKFIYVNERLLEIANVSFEEVSGYGWMTTIHPDDRKTAVEDASNAAVNRRALSAEFRLLTPQGVERWVHVIVEPMFSKYGTQIGRVGTLEDITERKRGEEALRESEERFRTLSASAPVGIFLMDNKGQVIYTNERLQAIAGVPPGGGSLEQLATAVHPDDREQLLTGWAKAAEERAELSQEYRILTPQGDTRWVRMHVCPIFSADGKQSGVVGTIEDITEQRQAAEDMANRLKMESAIAHASNLLAGPEDVDAALNLALRILAEAVGADRAHIFLLRDNNTRMDNTSEWCAPGIEPQIDNRQDLDYMVSPWWIDRLAQNEPIIMTNTSAAPPEAALEKKSWKALNIRSLLAVPLLSDGKPIGYVRFANMKSDSTEREEDIRLLRLASESIASFIERQRAGEDKRRAYESIVLLLATAAEARDPYTEDHLYRIRGFAEAIAAELGLPPEEIREIGLSSLLHDVGKMRVPDSILTKPGPLSAAEWKIMKQHPLWGEELLSAHPWLETARQIARWHHERWDGTGYPDGLRAEQIPLGAAIVAVADSLDAMISERPYKGAWPQQQAVREIRMHNGRQYSPDVVEAFNRALRKGEIKRVADATLRLSKLARAA